MSIRSSTISKNFKRVVLEVGNYSRSKRKSVGGCTTLKIGCPYAYTPSLLDVYPPHTRILSSIFSR